MALNMDKKRSDDRIHQEMPDYVRIIRRDYPGGQMSRDIPFLWTTMEKPTTSIPRKAISPLHIAELTPDYTGHTGKYVRAFINRYMEALLFAKTRAILSYRFRMHGAPNAARSAVAKNIAGPWMELKNPCVGPKAGITFGGQSTFILPVQGKPGKFIFMADIWRPNAMTAVTWAAHEMRVTRLSWNGRMNGRWMTCNLSPSFMQDTVYCFHLLAGRQKREPSVCLVLRSPCCSSLAASSGMAFLGGLHCLGTSLRGNADCSTHHPFHPLPALRKRRASILPANLEEQRMWMDRLVLECWLRFNLFYMISHLPWPGKIIRWRPTLPGKNGKKNLPVTSWARFLRRGT